jgi:hypothetical protein
LLMHYERSDSFIYISQTRKIHAYKIEICTAVLSSFLAIAQCPASQY